MLSHDAGAQTAPGQIKEGVVRLGGSLSPLRRRICPFKAFVWCLHPDMDRGLTDGWVFVCVSLT